uniref:ATP-dependent RNA helicase rhlB n=1 Tax=Lygus hesperus TaxID=30085 RepID=A0A0A9WQ33_LYGHE
MMKDRDVYKIPLRERRPRMVLLAPTRELIKQLEHVCSILDKHTGLQTRSFTSCKRANYHVSKLLKRHMADVLIMHPKVILRLLRVRRLFLDDLRYVVVDEADAMMSGHQDFVTAQLLAKVRHRNMYQHL